MDKIIIDYNYLSSALCDIVDVKETLVSLDVDRNTIKKIEYVKKFLESLIPENDVVGKTDLNKLSVCISNLKEVEAELDEDILNEAKDNEGTDITVEDCIQDVLSFLQSLETNS